MDASSLPDARDDLLLLIDSVRDYAIFLLDSSGRVVSWSSGAERIKGFRAAEIIGRHFSVFYPAEDVASGKPEHELAVAARVGRVEDEGWRIRKDGTRFWASVVITALRSPSGELRGFGKVTRDLSERWLGRRVEEILAAVTDGIVAKDAAGAVVYGNRAAMHMLAGGSDDVAELEIARLDERFEAFQEDGRRYPLDRLPAAQLVRGESPAPVLLRLHERRTGQDRWMRVGATAVHGCDGRLQLAIAVWRDASEELRARNAARDAREAVRVRDDFLSIAGHELRTPLTALQLQLQSLEAAFAAGRVGDPDGRWAERLRRTVGQGRRLERLVEELLDVSRITSGRLVLEREQMDLVPVVREVLERHAAELARAGSTIRFAHEGRTTGCWDRDRIDQVVTNLLANAIKYGRGAPIDVCVQGGDDAVRILVKDQGIGIDPAAQARIFGRFERAVSERHYGGLGLGLWIVRQIVEAHGGHVRFESAPDVGSTFVAELPYEASPARGAG